MNQDWFTAGSLIRINEYEFDDDGSRRDKYMFVLYNDNEKAFIIDCLTTSKNKGVIASNSGCSIYNNKIPYFFFPANQIIGTWNYFFDLDTYIFFKDNIRLEEISKFDKQVARSIFGIAKLDQLKEPDLKRLIKCALKSKFVPMGVVNVLASFKTTLA